MTKAAARTRHFPRARKISCLLDLANFRRSEKIYSRRRRGILASSIARMSRAERSQKSWPKVSHDRGCCVLRRAKMKSCGVIRARPLSEVGIEERKLFRPAIKVVSYTSAPAGEHDFLAQAVGAIEDGNAAAALPASMAYISSRCAAAEDECVEEWVMSSVPRAKARIPGGTLRGAERRSSTLPLASHVPQLRTLRQAWHVTATFPRRGCFRFAAGLPRRLLRL